MGGPRVESDNVPSKGRQRALEAPSRRRGLLAAWCGGRSVGAGKCSWKGLELRLARPKGKGGHRVGEKVPASS